MTNYSRTTLRELKKRYLNILKKCLLANLMAFSFVLPSMAETITNPTTNEELLEALLDPTKRVDITDPSLEYIITLNGEELTTPEFNGDGAQNKSGFLNNKGTIHFKGTANFTDNDQNMNGRPASYGSINNEGNITFETAYFKNNDLYSNTAGSISSSIGNKGYIEFFSTAIFENNTAEGINTQSTGISNSTLGIMDENGKIIKYGVSFKDVSFIKNKATSTTSHVYAATIYNTGSINFSGKTIFKENIGLSKKNTAFGGAYTNTKGIMVFSDVDFLNNKIISGTNKSYGGAIRSSQEGAKNIFNGKAVFKGNISQGLLDATGGAIQTWMATFEFNDVDFINNKAISIEGIGSGGGIYSTGFITLGNNFTFSGNEADKGKDIYNGKVLTLTGKQGTIGTIEGGIAGSSEGSFNKSGAGLLVLGDNSENHEYEGAFTQTAGTTIANSEAFFSHEKAVNTINGGELKTHGAEIAYKATLGETGTLTHLGTSVDTPTEIKDVTFNGTGLNLTLGTYTKAEQEKEISLVGDRLVEYVDDKGTEDPSDDELVSYQATDKLFTVKALENDQKAKFILNENLTGMDGNTLTIDNAKLDVAEGLKVLGTVVAKDMTLSKGITPVSFTEVTVAKEGVLDIGTREVTVEDMTLQEGATLKIALNSLQEHGKVNGLITGTSTSQLALNLATDVEMGTYQLFDQDNDIALEENLFFNIKDLENGAYQVEKKTTSELASTFGGETEAKVATALMEGESSNEAFSKMQSEMLEALQSEDKAQVQKAKKALSAVGASEQPSSQSIAASHFNELTRVISQMAMEKEAEIVGHSGGDTDPRAKVYIKGLYDRTKSSMGDGFRARSKGAVLGVQSEVTDTLTLGVGYATSQTTAKEDLRRTEVDTNTGFVSAHYQPNAWWVSGLATFSRGEYEEEKQVLSSTGKASYNVDSWGAQVMTGYDIKLETAVITQEVGMRYLSVKQEGYTDTLGTTVSGTQSDYLTALVGVKGTWGMGAIRPTAGVTVGYDIISDDVSALNTLANGASYTVNGEALDRLSTGVSLGVEADLGDRTTLKLEYSGTFRKEYTDHSGMLKLEMKF